MAFIEFLLTVAVITFVIYAFFNISYLIEMRRTSVAMRQLITKTGENLHPTLSAVRSIFDNFKTIADNAAVLSKSLRDAAEALTVAQNAITDIYQSYAVNLGQKANANIAGLKAGIKTGVVTLFNNLKDKKEGLS